MRLIKALIITWSFAVQAGLPPTTLSGQSSATKPTTFTFKAPYSQATQISGIESLIETGDENMLVDPGMESSGVAAYTCTVGTCTKTTVSGEFSSGKQALKVALSSQAMNVSQTVNTPLGIQKQGYVRVLYRVPAAMADFQICSIVNSAEQTCVPTNNLIKDDTFRSIEIPLTFNATNAGIKFKTTTAYSGNAFFDAAVVAQGLGTQNLMLDNVYSANVTTTSGVIANQSKTFIASCTAANPTVCTFTTGVFTTAPNCWTTNYSAGPYVANIGTINSSSVSITTMTGGGVNTASVSFSLSCQKSGNDYLAASANVYSSTNGNYSRRAYTPTLTNLGTSPSSDCYESREGEMNAIDCKITVGSAPPASVVSISLPGTNVSQAFTSIRMVGQMDSASIGSIAQQVGSTYSILSSPSSSVLNYGYRNSGSGGLAARNGNGLTAGDVLSFTARIPIAGWSNSNVIVGSFEKIEKCTGATECVDIFTANINSAGVVSNENQDWINGNCTMSAGISVCTYNSSIFTVAPTCSAMNQETGTNRYVNNIPSNTTTTTQLYNSAGTGTNTAYQLSCVKSGVDSKPKTAKVASSIGVPTVPGITTEVIDTFSFSYGTTNATTICSASPCSYLDQIGNSISSVTRSSVGVYNLNTTKTYSKLKCSLVGAGASLPISIYASSLSCSNCNTFSFQTVRTSTETSVDSYGLLQCQGSY